MEVEYSLTLEDLQAFSRYHQRHGPGLDARARAKRLIILLVIFFVPAGLMPLIASLLPKLDLSGLDLLWYGLFVGWFLCYILQFVLSRAGIFFSVKRYYDNEESRWIFSPRRMNITPEVLSITSEYEKTTCSWAVVWSIDAVRDHVFFYTTRMGAQIVPRRAFRDKRHFQAFVDLAFRYQQNWKPQTESSDEILDALPAQATGITRQPPT